MINNLTLQQELFCKLYTQNDECFGNGAISYAEAYGYNLESRNRTPQKDVEGKDIRLSSDYDKAYNVCANAASQNLRKPYIQERITDILNEMMTDKQIDSEMMKVARQNRDLAAKMRAISEFNKLKKRITELTDITTGGEKISTILPEVIAEADRLLKERKLS